MTTQVVTTHMTYPSAECIKCKRVSLRVCILHDACEFGNRIDSCGGHF